MNIRIRLGIAATFFFGNWWIQGDIIIAVAIAGTYLLLSGLVDFIFPK